VVDCTRTPGLGVAGAIVIESDPPEGTDYVLTGPVTLYEVSAIREALRAALAGGQPLRIDLSESGPWDIAGLQLLISCVRSGRRRGQEVRVVNPPRSCADTAERSGLSGWLRSAGE
jgi:ABC-type transporter Mla MlaB component